MRKAIYIILFVVGVIIIGICSFVIPKDPFVIIPSITGMFYDKPLWLNIMILGCTIYFFVLYSLYDRCK